MVAEIAMIQGGAPPSHGASDQDRGGAIKLGRSGGEVSFPCFGANYHSEYYPLVAVKLINSIIIYSTVAVHHSF